MIYLAILALIGASVTAYLFSTGYIKIEDVSDPEIPPEEPKQAPVPVPEPIPVIPPPMPEKSNRERLYDVAKASIGKDMSPLDKAPDKLGCMESLNGVYLACFGEHLLPANVRLSTHGGYKQMLNDPRLYLIRNEDALPGDIVISPTGYSTKGAPNGHCGVRGFTEYMSNDSDTGLWKANYRIANWSLVFKQTLGFPIYHFRVR